MPTQVRTLKPPQGLSRILYRLPIGLYKIGLGGMFGNRFVLLAHKGRKTGLERKVVLEVVRYDRESGSCIVAAGFGSGSDWVRNITSEPHINFTIGRTSRNGLAVRLSEEEAGLELVRYEKEHPMAWEQLSRFMGYQLDGTEEDTHALGRMMPMFRFQPEENIIHSRETE